MAARLTSSLSILYHWKRETVVKQVTNILMLVIFLTLGVISAMGQTAESRTSPIGAGATAPDFTLADHNGKTVKLSAARGKSPVVLVFYRGYW